MFFYILCTLLLINALTTEAATVGKVGKGCSDSPKHAKICYRLQQNNECNSKYEYLQSFAATYCPETCNLCQGVSSGNA
ncbi:hypothetical protein GCK32_013101 [Trichostrongylus colubriformis]|uniref:ShKT domain-containing protein n=1 Tax=Trichostrongylus colubriformis TaxID=6319 RepID=A0AAN8IPP9_TRICO